MTPSIITRIWHGRTRTHHAEDYLRYLQESGIADYRSTPGNLGAQVLRRLAGDVRHFWTITRWPDYDSIRRFAGAQYAQARYYPEDARYLLELEPTVQHCETFAF